MQSLDFLVMRIGSNSFPPPLYTHESPPCCAHAFVNPVCGWKRNNPRRTWADRRALRHRLMCALARHPYFPATRTGSLDDPTDFGPWSAHMEPRREGSAAGPLRRSRRPRRLGRSGQSMFSMVQRTRG
jgi:hypothetical protein